MSSIEVTLSLEAIVRRALERLLYRSEDVSMLVKQYSLNTVRLSIEYRSVVALRGDSCSVARCQYCVGRPALTKNGI